MNIDNHTLMRLAREEAKRYHHKYIRTEHLLLALMTVVSIDQLTHQHIDPDCILQAVAVMRCPTCDAEEKMELSASAQRAFQLAHSYATPHPVQVHHLLYGILQSSQTVKQILVACGVNLALLIESLESKGHHDK